jgi:phosphatidylglycerophosphate synthase
VPLPAEPEAAPLRVREGQSALCIVGSCDVALWALTPRERLERQFAREGVTAVLTPEEARERNGPVVFVRADAVLDSPLVPVLVRRPNLVLVGEGAEGEAPVAVTLNGTEAESALALLAGGEPRAGLKLITRTPAGLDASFWKALRKRETPYALVLTAANRKAVEWRMFMGTYKGATDFVTKHLWPRPAFHATRWLAPRGVTPNMVTAAAALLMVLAFWLFLEGRYWPGLAAAWAMTFLDTVDGKLARTTLTSSKWGDVFDHGIDLVHPPFWYGAWALGLAQFGRPLPVPELWLVLGAILAGYVVQRLMEGIAIKWLGLEVHIWRPIDTAFRQITARRNPNLALLTASMLAARPDLGLLAVAAWTLLCLLLHAIQLGQAFAAKPNGEPLTSWMSRPPERP